MLIGFDMRRAEVDGKPDQEHWHGAHPKGLTQNSSYGRFVTGMGEMAADLHAAQIEVLNCSSISLLPYWPKRSLIDCLA